LVSDVDRAALTGEFADYLVPAARAHLDPQHGHLSFAVTALDQIIDELVELAG
jgi:hypothetical protein